jgi:hypothetical protein
VAEKQFDSERGYYYEIVVTPNRNKHSDWTREHNTPHAVTKPAPSAKGARSLAEIARAKVVHEFSNLTSEHFASIPWAMAESIWEQVMATYGPSYYRHQKK